MNVEEIKAEYLDAIDEVGESVSIRIYTGTSDTYADSIVRARVVEFAADQLVGPIVQGDRKLIMLAADVEDRGIELTATQNCKVVVRGKELQIKSIDDNTRRVAGELIAYELRSAADMASATDAYDAIRERLDAVDSGISIPLRWHGEDNGPLPDTPDDFAYVVFDNMGSRPGPVAFGGGLYRNLYRNLASVTVFVFTPNRKGVRAAIVEAETIAARLRSFRDTDIFCRSADVTPVGDGASISPPGLQRNELNNYLCAVVEVDISFDQVG